MPRAAKKSAPTKVTKRKSTRRAQDDSDSDSEGVSGPSLGALQAVQKARIEQYNTVKNTASAYKGYLQRGKAFLKKLVAKQRKGKGESESDLPNEDIPIDELEKAFSKPPNRWSALALELYIVDKCYNEQRGENTADGIHGAFAELWDNMDNDHYAGEYFLNEETGEVRGCPARAASVKALIKSVKTRGKSKGEAATCNHADAITVEEMKRLMQWSEKECPNELLTPESMKDVDDVEALKHRLEHGFMRAFMSSAFTLWTRCFEMLSLQAKDIQDNCQGPAPYYIPHFKVHLTNQKGWQQAKGYDGPRTSNIYDIYQQDITEIDMNTHFLRWQTLLECVLGAKLKPNDYLFPQISVNGVIRTAKEMTYDSLQAMLSKFCKGAGLEKRYTTHSFRRGGAQYCFMFAPIGKRWSLNRIRWWGGWAVGEHVDTLIKYLVDSLQSFESGHGDALHPIPLEQDASFMGDHTLVKTATTEEVRQLALSMNTQFDTLLSAVTQPAPAIRHIVHQPTLCHCGTSMPTVAPASLHQTAAQFESESVVSESPGQIEPYHPVIGSTTIVESVSNLGFYNTSELRSCPPLDPDTTHMRPVRSIPIPNISIPPLGRAPGAWRRAIKQWEEVDPATGLALKDWPVEWYSGRMRTVTGSSRSQRQIVFEEFVRLGRDENSFLEVYPEADESMANLLVIIRKNSKRGRRSKNGTPQQRGSSSEASASVADSDL